MYKQFYSRENWHKLNSFFTQKICKNTDSLAFLYKDTHVALLELLWGLGRQHLTRRKIYFVENQSPYFILLRNFFLNLNYEVMDLPIEVFTNPNAHIGDLDHSTLAVVFSKDTPFLAKTWDTQNLCKCLFNKKIVQVEIVHEAQNVRGVILPTNPFHSVIYDFLGLASLVILGRRIQYESPISRGQNWDDFDAETIVDRISSRVENPLLVRSFESNLPHETWTLPGSGLESEPEPKMGRVYDRSVFAWSDLSATALISELSSQNSRYQSLQTSCLITWGGLTTMSWLESFLPSPLYIRGLVSAPLEIVEREEFLSDLLSAREKILNLQGMKLTMESAKIK